MVSRTLLSAIGVTIWAAVLVTAAPRAISHRHDFYDYSEARSIAISAHEDAPVANCSDLNIEFNGHKAVVQSEEKTISKALCPLNSMFKSEQFATGATSCAEIAIE